MIDKDYHGILGEVQHFFAGVKQSRQEFCNNFAQTLPGRFEHSQWSAKVTGVSLGIMEKKMETTIV